MLSDVMKNRYLIQQNQPIHKINESSCVIGRKSNQQNTKINIISNLSLTVRGVKCTNMIKCKFVYDNDSVDN